MTRHEITSSVPFTIDLHNARLKLWIVFFCVICFFANRRLNCSYSADLKEIPIVTGCQKSAVCASLLHEQNGPQFRVPDVTYINIFLWVFVAFLLRYCLSRKTSGPAPNNTYRTYLRSSPSKPVTLPCCTVRTVYSYCKAARAFA